jgi:hypothetical protein
MRSRGALYSLGLVMLVAASAGGQGVAGTWRVTFDSDVRQDGETFTVTKRGTGQMVLEQRGDSIHGTFKPDGIPDGPRAISGTWDGKVLKLTTGTVRRTVNVNGKPTEMPTRTDWMGGVDVGALRGTMFIQLGDRPAPPRKWEATR